MTEVSAWTTPVSVSSREPTYDEVAGLDRLRAVLASTIDRTDARAISWLWDSMVATHGGGPAPAGFVEAVATALGDLLAVHVSGARWAVWPGPAGPTLGVASRARPQAPVVPFPDAQDRWDAGSRDWIVDYLARAATHLSGGVPRQRRSPGAVSSVPAPAPPPSSDPAARGASGADVAGGTPHESHGSLQSHVRRERTGPDAGDDEPLQDFALDALDHAMGLLRETGAFDQEAFVLLLDGSGARRTESCAGDPGDAGLRARELVRSSGAARAAITWIDRDPADLPGPRQLFPAVIVDAWDAGVNGVRVGRRFVDDVLGTGPLGGPLVLGPIAPLL